MSREDSLMVILVVRACARSRSRSSQYWVGERVSQPAGPSRSSSLLEARMDPASWCVCLSRGKKGGEWSEGRGKTPGRVFLRGRASANGLLGDPSFHLAAFGRILFPFSFVSFSFSFLFLFLFFLVLLFWREFQVFMVRLHGPKENNRVGER